MDVAIVTWSGLPLLDAYDAPILTALADLKVVARPCVWDDPAVDWSQPQAVVVRTAWDSHLRRDAFLAWASRVGRLTRLFNPADVLRWNTHKSYLRELEARGVPVTPTVWVPQGGTADVAALLRERGWEALVMKPVVSAGALKTYRFGREAAQAAQAQLDALAREGEVMLQPYLTAFEREGERSYIFFDGEFSHSVRRPPGLLGSPLPFPEPHAFAPRADEVGLAHDVLAAVGRSLMYARVDVATDNEGRSRLQELEVTEPRLFLTLDTQAPKRLARAIVRRLA